MGVDAQNGGRHSVTAACLAVAALLLCAAAPPEESEIRRAAAMLDYVARGYGLAVSGGQVVNAPEYDEQQAFAQEAGDVLDRLPQMRPFVSDCRALEALVRAKSPAGEVAAKASALGRSVLEAAGLGISPPPDVLSGRGLAFYAEACAACHGAEGRGNGPSAPGLSTPATDFTGPDRDQLTPYRVYSAETWGVPRTAMPAFDSMSEEQRWEIAIGVLEFGHSLEDARRGEELARARGLIDGRRELVVKSDAELREQFAAFPPGEVRALLAWVRRIAPFAGKPPAAFPDLTTEVALASIPYVHGQPWESERRLREAQLGSWEPLEPLVPPEKIGPVRDGFAEARARVAVPGPRERVLLAVAQVVRRIAEAGPEQLPEPVALRLAGVRAAALPCAPAALALCGALLLGAGKRKWLAVALVCAGAGAGAMLAPGWRILLGLEAASVMALAISLCKRQLASLAAGAAAAASAAEIARSCAAVRQVFSAASSDMQYAALSIALAWALIAFALARIRRARPRAFGTIALAAALLLAVLPAARKAWIARTTVAQPR